MAPTTGWTVFESVVYAVFVLRLSENLFLLSSVGVNWRAVACASYKDILMKKIKVQPSGITYSVDDDETTILDGALQSNVALEYSCKTGACGSCKARVVLGEIDRQDPQELLSDEEVSGGVFLTCCSKPLTDCEIEAHYYAELSEISRKVIPAKVSEVNYPSDDVALIRFRIPPTANFNYLPGQYINLNFGGISRSYSIANSQNSSTGIELHVRKVPDGAMSKHVFEDMRLDTLVRIDGPIGTFFVHKSKRPLIFLAGGTGFAPVKAMVEELIATEDARPIHIYWGAQSASGLYSAIPEEWAKRHERISYTPVVSGCDDSWQGRKGFVHISILEDFDSLRDVDIYACGSPLMIDVAKRDCIARNLPADRFFSDAFVASTN